MKLNEVRECTTCNRYALGCEESCTFNMDEDGEKRKTLLEKRKAMKAERKKGIQKAEILISSARKAKGQKNLYDIPKKSYQHADKNLKKQKAYREKRVAKNVSKK